MGNLRKEAIAKYKKKYPHLPDLTLAALLVRQEPALFFTIQSTRLSIQYYTGKRKNGSGKSAKEPIKSVAPVSDVPYKYRASVSLAEAFEDYVVHGEQRVLCLYDIHFPVHNAKALEAAISYGQKIDPTIILLGGDVIDVHDFMTHERNPRKRTFEAEIAMVVAEVEALKKLFPKARIIWIEGNHEYRLPRYYNGKAVEMPILTMPELIRAMMKDHTVLQGVEWVDNKRTVRIGKMAFIHGHEFRGGGGQYPAAWLMARVFSNASCGHFHRTDNCRRYSLGRKDEFRTYTFGCLADLTPGYMPYNQWNHGFGVFTCDKDGDFEMRNLIISPNGKVRD